MKPRILVAGVGNIFLGDDAFGVEVVKLLLERQWPDEVRVEDFGIRGIDLTYALLEGYEAVVLIDASPRGGDPGDLYLIEPEVADEELPTGSPPMIEAHNLDPAKVLQIVQSLGGDLERVLVVACEPTPLGSNEEMTMEMSGPVRAALSEAVKMVEELVSKLLVEPTGPKGD